MAPLRTQLQPRVGKIWLFQPSLHSYFRKREAILITQDPGVRWDYHVALVFHTESDGEQVLDMALGRQLMSVDEWIGQYEVPDNSVLVTTTGSYYSYFSAGG
jgi:Glutaminase